MREERRNMITPVPLKHGNGRGVSTVLNAHTTYLKVYSVWSTTAASLDTRRLFMQVL